MGNELLKAVDPELHTLRSVIRSIGDNRIRAEAETARFKLYESLEAGDGSAARRWWDALQRALAVMPQPDLWSKETYESVAHALAKIGMVLNLDPRKPRWDDLDLLATKPIAKRKGSK